MDQCILKAIQQEIRRIECKLDNPRTGLAEIKSEVAAIECAIQDLDMHEIICKLKALDEHLEDVLDAVDDVEDRLDNPQFGLEEIKEEVRQIERALACMNLTPVLGLLNQIKQEVHEIECKLDNPEFGLREIKEEVAAIEDAVTDCKTGLPALHEDVEEIEDLLENPEFGLAEIKQEVAAIERKLENQSHQQLLALLAAIKGIVLCIQQKLENPEFGLEEIKSEVRGIEETLCDRHFGLPEIKDEIEDIECILRKLDLEETLALLGAIEAEVMGLECKIDNICIPVDEINEKLCAIKREICDPEHGLAEIKAEIEEILENQSGTAGITYLTSGPVFRANGSNSVIVVVINNSASAQSITIEGFSRLPSQGNLPGSPANLNVPAVTAAAVVFDLPAVVTTYEIRVNHSILGSITVFSASRTQNSVAPLAASTLLPENTIKNAEFRPYTPGVTT